MKNFKQYFTEATKKWNNNPKLTSLAGAPKEVGEYFYCSLNPKLTSLAGAPQVVGGTFNCHGNPNLTSLEGAPKAVGRDFCYDLTIPSLEGLPEVIKGKIFGYDHAAGTRKELKPYEVRDIKVKLGLMKAKDIPNEDLFES